MKKKGRTPKAAPAAPDVGRGRRPKAPPAPAVNPKLGAETRKLLGKHYANKYRTTRRG